MFTKNKNDTYRSLLIAHTTLEDHIHVNNINEITLNDYYKYNNLTSIELLNLHKDKYHLDTQSSYIGISGGDQQIATAINSSLYYIYNSIRDDWPYGISPGGLAINAYNGHSFWDCETWIYPIILSLDNINATLSRSLLNYRNKRLNAAIERASARNYNGAMYPWESAYTGIDVTPPPNIEGEYEIHISGDIALAYRLQYFATKDLNYLKNQAWPVVKEICKFFSTRVIQRKSDHLYTILNVQPPDEHANIVNSSIYTNAIAAETLKFCIEISNIFPNDIQIPDNYTIISNNMYYPMTYVNYNNKSIYIHAEFDYWPIEGQLINQADVALLQYPLNYAINNHTLAFYDLQYYQSKTPHNGYYTGQSVYDIAYIRLGYRKYADLNWPYTFEHIDTNNFYIWKETTDGSHSHFNFLTGAGGFLQSIINGYAGIQYISSGIILYKPLILPYQVNKFTINGLLYLNNKLELTIYSSNIFKITLIKQSSSNILCIKYYHDHDDQLHDNDDEQKLMINQAITLKSDQNYLIYQC